MIAPALLVWWLRPVSRATRVGEQSAVVWKRLYLSPWLARRSSVGMGIGAAERARVAEADVVDQKDDDVRRALGRLHLEPRRRLGIARVELGGARIVRLRRWEAPFDSFPQTLWVGMSRWSALIHQRRQRPPT